MGYLYLTFYGRREIHTGFWEDRRPPGRIGHVSKDIIKTFLNRIDGYRQSYTKPENGKWQAVVNVVMNKQVI
jgi:hypothetical protein